MIYKYGVIYREVMHTPRIDLCSILNKDKIENLMVSYLVKVVDDSCPGIVHPCPYTVKLFFINLEASVTFIYFRV